MAAISIDEEDDSVVIECRDPNLIERLIEQSSYFHSLLNGNFSESSMCRVSIHWSLETFLLILRFIHGCHMEITICNFLPLCRASLYFGFEKLVLECRNWFGDITTKEGIFSYLKLDELVNFWEFGFDHGELYFAAAINWISALCISCVARNFMWALSCDTFVALPFEFLVSCVKHPHLTVDSERHLCEALLAWLRANMEPLEHICCVEDSSNDKSKQMIVTTHDWTSILDEIRVNNLPLWFIMGSYRCCYFSPFAKKGVLAIMNRFKKFSRDPNYVVDACDQSCMRIRLTEYSKKSFPFLRTIRMAYFLDFETKKLFQLLENKFSVREVDLTVDVNLVLLHIAEVCISLCYLNIKGCSSVTDVGIANLILKCRKLHSIIATDTPFGSNSASALCSRGLDGESSQMEINNDIELSDTYVEVLHIGGCKGVSETSIGDILSRVRMIKNLCLRDTLLVDHAVYRFSGSSLEILDVSNTMISRDALSYLLTKNLGLRYLEARGCKELCTDQIEQETDLLSSDPCDKLFSLLGQECKLEELIIGWGFSYFSLYSMGSALRSLRAINVGLGGSLGPEGLTLLCTLSPLLESVTILFQV
ncbi:BTB/POZ domain-containing protein FBL11 [Bienertia sinuspersici]